MTMGRYRHQFQIAHFHLLLCGFTFEGVCRTGRVYMRNGIPFVLNIHTILGV